MKNKSRIFLSIFLVLGTLLIFGCGCKEKNPRKYEVSLEIWGVLDSKDNLQEIFENYVKMNPNVSSIVYKRIPVDTYRSELIEAMASGRGPDIFMINNAWLPSFIDKVSNATEFQPKIINEQKFRSNFADVATDDFVRAGKVFAVPLSINSLGLYYNKDLLNKEGITSPPKNWNEFIDSARKLTKIDDYGNIVQSGASIGTAYNINRSTDILNLIMLQNGTEVVDEKGRVTFEKPFVSGERRVVSSGEEALHFYTQFSNINSPNYIWNPTMHYSVDAFSTGKVAMMLNYSWQIKEIQNKSPKLNFAVAPAPQFESGKKVNFANYWGFTVAKNKIPRSNPYGDANVPTQLTNEDRIFEAWQFLTYLTTKPDGTFPDQAFDPAMSYLIKSGEPAARRDLIEMQRTDPLIGFFAIDNLIAKSWVQADSVSIESIFLEMIDQVNKGQTTVSEAMLSAKRRIQPLYSTY